MASVGTYTVSAAGPPPAASSSSSPLCDHASPPAALPKPPWRESARRRVSIASCTASARRAWICAGVSPPPPLRPNARARAMARGDPALRASLPLAVAWICTADSCSSARRSAMARASLLLVAALRPERPRVCRWMASAARWRSSWSLSARWRSSWRRASAWRAIWFLRTRWMRAAASCRPSLSLCSSTCLAMRAWEWRAPRPLALAWMRVAAALAAMGAGPRGEGLALARACGWGGGSDVGKRGGVAWRGEGTRAPTRFGRLCTRSRSILPRITAWIWPA
mmetsp:Transcript_10201/g.30212  ORF Transcript_10201/g.30212 Transcript_10201/m.30212 type:complete len:281 (+) Transcript_10201:347-1189(+)